MSVAANVKLDKLNTQIAEQANALLESIRVQVSCFAASIVTDLCTYPCIVLSSTYEVDYDNALHPAWYMPAHVRPKLVWSKSMLMHCAQLVHELISMTCLSQVAYMRHDNAMAYIKYFLAKYNMRQMQT